MLCAVYRKGSDPTSEPTIRNGSTLLLRTQRMISGAHKSELNEYYAADVSKFTVKFLVLH